MFATPITTLLATGLTMAALTTPTNAEAGSTRVHDHRKTEVVHDHRQKVTVRDHRTPRKNEVVVVDIPKLDCVAGYRSLEVRGFTAIQYFSCDGIFYLYTAIRNDAVYRAEMNAISGDFAFTFLGFAH